MPLSSLIRVPVRSYIQSFWNKGTCVEGLPGQKFPHQHFGRHRATYHVIQPLPRVSEIKRIKKFGLERKLCYPLGRKAIMEKILNEDKFYGESPY